MASSGFVLERQKGGMEKGRMDVEEKRWIVHVHLPSDKKGVENEGMEREKENGGMEKGRVVKEGGVFVEYCEANEERVEIKREEKKVEEVDLGDIMEKVVNELEEKRGGKESIWRAKEKKKEEGKRSSGGGLGEGLGRVFQCGMLHVVGIAAMSSEKDMVRRLKLFKKMVETKEEERDAMSEEEQEELSKFASWLNKEQKKKDGQGKSGGGVGQGMLMGGAGSGGAGNGLSMVDKLVYLYYANPKILLHSNIKNVIVEKVVVVIRDLRETMKYKRERSKKKMAEELVSLEKAIEKEENVERVESMRRNYEEIKERAIKFWDQFPEWEVGVVIHLQEKKSGVEKDGVEKEVVVDHEFELTWNEIEDICEVGGQYYASRQSVSIPPLFWSL